MSFFTNLFQCIFCDLGGAPYMYEEETYERFAFDEVFELGDVLGEGGYAVVRQGFNKKTLEKVAVKIAKRANIDSSKESAMRREFQILRSLNHPNIVRAIALFEEPTNFYVVLEYMDGGELFDRIVKKTQYTEKEARDAVRCVLGAVEYFHLHGVVHRDLKPENLLLASNDDDSKLKIADFGLARVIDGATVLGKAGTPEYWAPEVIESKPVSKPVDMWAVGVITFVILGGYAPFHNKDPHIMYANIVKGAFKFHPQRWSSVSGEAKEFICALLNVNPDKRLTASEALKHKWMHNEDTILVERNLTDNLEEFKKFNAQRKMRTGMQAIRGVAKLLRIVKSTNSREPESTNGSTPKNGLVKAPSTGSQGGASTASNTSRSATANSSPRISLGSYSSSPRGVLSSNTANGNGNATISPKQPPSPGNGSNGIKQPSPNGSNGQGFFKESPKMENNKSHLPPPSPRHPTTQKIIPTANDSSK